MRVFVLASGPSLGFDNYRDVKTIGRIKGGDVDSTTIAVNSTIFSAPFADVCYAWDHWWWKAHHAAVKKLGCRRISVGANTAPFGVEIFPRDNQSEFSETAIGGSNSGHHAINLAYLLGAREIVLLGFDCQHTEGRAHHHEDHPQGNNAAEMNNWRNGFPVLAKALADRGVTVINCTRETALDCFERMTLEDYLGC